MPIFLKAGLWKSAKKGNEGELNLSALSGSAPTYKVYTALVTQTGTDDPVATVLRNTLGGEVVWARTGVGNYTGTLVGAFKANKTVSPLFPALSFETNGTFVPLSINANPQLGWINMYLIGEDAVEIDTYDMVGFQEWSTILGSSFLVEIIVYN